jgi:hypothetical protein
LLIIDQQADLSSDVCANFYKSLLQFVCPASSIPPSLEQRLSQIDLSKYSDDESQGSLSFMTFKTELGDDHIYLDQRQQQWILAFESIYATLRNGHCPYFYVLVQDSPILFIAARVNDIEQVRVIMAHTTTQFRAKLKDENIKFERLQNDTILFIGKRRVHAFYDFLLQYITIQSLIRDVPVIISPVAFVHSTLRTLKVSHKQFTKFNKKAQRMDTEYMLKLEGYILPHTWYHLLPIMQQAQQGDFTLKFIEFEIYTDMLNNAQSADVPAMSQGPSQMTQLGLTQQAGGYWLNNMNNEEFSYLSKKETKDMNSAMIQQLVCIDNVYTNVKIINTT